MSFLTKIGWSSYEVETRFLYIILFITVATIILLPVILDPDTMSTIFILSAVMIFGLFLFLFIAKTCYDESLYVKEQITYIVDQNKAFLVQKVQNVTNPVKNITTASNATDLEIPSTDMWHISETYCDVAVGASLQYYKYYRKFVSNFMDVETLTNDDIQKLGHKFCNQNINHVRDNMYQWGMEILNWFAGNVSWFGTGLTTFFKTTLDVINGLGDIMFSLLMFLMFLYYFIRYDGYFSKQLRSYSPLTKTETKKIANSVASKVVNTFYYAMVLAACRFMTTWMTFYYSQFKIIWVFSFISGFLSIIPIISSWVVWIPAAIFCIARDGLWSTPWFVIVAAHMGLYAVDSWLYTSFFKGDTDQRPEVLGVSIILGVYAFGWTGVFKGPLSIGLTITLMQIYKEYMTQVQEEEEKDKDSGLMKHRRGRRGHPPIVRQTSLVDQVASRVQDLLQGLSISPTSKRISVTPSPMSPSPTNVDTPKTPNPIDFSQNPYSFETPERKMEPLHLQVPRANSPARKRTPTK